MEKEQPETLDLASPPKKKRKNVSDSEGIALFKSFDADETADMAATNPKQHMTARGELDAYLNAPRLNFTDKNEEYSNPLEWWEKYKLVFPRVYGLARIYLAIPATSAPVERVFSVAGNTISKNRCAMDPETSRCLVFIKENQKYFAPGHIPEMRYKRKKK